MWGAAVEHPRPIDCSVLQKVGGRLFVLGGTDNNATWGNLEIFKLWKKQWILDGQGNGLCLTGSKGCAGYGSDCYLKHKGIGFINTLRNIDWLGSLTL